MSNLEVPNNENNDASELINPSFLNDEETEPKEEYVPIVAKSE